jgi:hypothetical protein
MVLCRNYRSTGMDASPATLPSTTAQEDEQPIADDVRRANSGPARPSQHRPDDIWESTDSSAKVYLLALHRAMAAEPRAGPDI